MSHQAPSVTLIRRDDLPADWLGPGESWHEALADDGDGELRSIGVFPISEERLVEIVRLLNEQQVISRETRKFVADVERVTRSPHL